MKSVLDFNIAFLTFEDKLYIKFCVRYTHDETLQQVNEIVYLGEMLIKKREMGREILRCVNIDRKEREAMAYLLFMYCPNPILN